MSVETFEEWRDKARQYLRANVPPEKTDWSGGHAQGGLFAEDDSAPAESTKKISIPKHFLSLSVSVSCHRDPERWALLYTALWRLTHGEKHLFNLATDPVVRRLSLMQKAVRRDAHKAKAFVRFRLVTGEDGDQYIAWHQPDHKILPLVAPFFMRRFAVMRWTILTPDQSVHWDGHELLFGPGAPKSAGAAAEDGLEDLWRDYYRATFNPARIKLNMMRKEMPVRYWHTMPETDIIKELLNEAPERVEAMIALQEGFAMSAENFLPEMRDIDSLRAAAKKCQGCPLHKDATCTVFGEGDAEARVMVVGEQPGDEEDRQGRPFVGPAGHVLNRALGEAGVDRKTLYMTNAVKHFKHDRHGLERNHRTPVQREVTACHPWLREEVRAVKPEIIVAMGVTAGRSLLGPGFSLKTHHGKVHAGPDNTLIVPTYHPAAFLRMPDQDKAAEIYLTLVADLEKAAALKKA